MKTITYDDYLRLLGLLTLAESHRKALEAIERAAWALLDSTPQGDVESERRGSHISDEIWGGYHRGVAELLRVLEITVEEKKS